MRFLVSLPAGAAACRDVHALLHRAARVACATAHTTLVGSLARACAARDSDSGSEGDRDKATPLFFCCSDAEDDVRATTCADAAAALARRARPHVRLGSGAATVHLLQQCYQSELRTRTASESATTTATAATTNTALAEAKHASTSSSSSSSLPCTHNGGGGVAMSDFAAWLTRERRVLVHGGGHSRRLPSYSTMGKLLMPMPQAALPLQLVLPQSQQQQQPSPHAATTRDDDAHDDVVASCGALPRHMDQTLLSLQLPLLATIADAAPPHLSTLVACGDVYLQPHAHDCDAGVRTLRHDMATLTRRRTTTTSVQAQDNNHNTDDDNDDDNEASAVDVVCIGIRSTPSRLQRHGVLCVRRRTPHELVCMLQKPTAATLHAYARDAAHGDANACDLLLDTGVWLLSARAVAHLQQQSCRPAHGLCTRSLLPSSSQQQRLSPYELYSDFGLTLGTQHRDNKTRATTTTAAATATTTRAPAPLAALRVRVVELTGFDFHHVGTSADLLATASAVDAAGAVTTAAAAVVHRSVVAAPLPSRGAVWIDASYVSARWRLHTHHILTGLPPPPSHDNKNDDDDDAHATATRNTAAAHDDDDKQQQQQRRRTASRPLYLPAGVCVSVERVQRDVALARQPRDVTHTRCCCGGDGEGAPRVLLVPRPYSLYDTFAPPSHAHTRCAAAVDGSTTPTARDDDSSSSNASSAQFLSQPLSRWLAQRGLCFADVAPRHASDHDDNDHSRDDDDDDDDNNSPHIDDAAKRAGVVRQAAAVSSHDAASCACDVQYARLFPCCDDVDTLYRLLQWMLPRYTHTHDSSSHDTTTHNNDNDNDSSNSTSTWHVDDDDNEEGEARACAALWRRLPRLAASDLVDVADAHAACVHGAHMQRVMLARVVHNAATRHRTLYTCVDLGVLAHKLAMLRLPPPPPLHAPPLPPLLLPPSSSSSSCVTTTATTTTDNDNDAAVATANAKDDDDMALLACMQHDMLVAQTLRCIAATTAAAPKGNNSGSGKADVDTHTTVATAAATATTATATTGRRTRAQLLAQARTHEQHARALLSQQQQQRLQDDDDNNDAAQTTMTRAVRDACACSATVPRQPLPRLAVRAGQVVRCCSPVRVDLCGGWTDTPPYNMLCGSGGGDSGSGGSVVNVAVNIDGQPPLCVTVCARARTCVSRSPVIVLRACHAAAGRGDAQQDVTAERVLRSYDDVHAPLAAGAMTAADEDDNDTVAATSAAASKPFAIARAALQLVGFARRRERHGSARRQQTATLPSSSSCADTRVHFDTLSQQLQQCFAGHDLVITQHVHVPAGAGLGGSSLLAATLLQALATFCGVPWSDAAVAQRVLALEQMIGTGGGWQDALGGMYGGVKCLRACARTCATTSSVVSLPQAAVAPPAALLPRQGQRGTRTRWSSTDVQCTPLSPHVFTHTDFAARHLLYFVGNTRAARPHVMHITRNMLLRDTTTMQVLHEMQHELVPAMCDALARADWAAYGAVVHASWLRNCRLCRHTTTAAVERTLQRVEAHLVGAKLVGAGGGGFLYMAAKDAQSAQHVRGLLARHPASPHAHFVDMKLSPHGSELVVV